MKNISVLLLLILSINGNSQMLTFDQAQGLRKKTLAEVESFLTARKWEMTEAEEETTDRMGKVVFGYEVSMYDSEKATSWVIFSPSSIGSDYNRLSIQVNKSTQYNAFMSRVAANGYKLKSSKIEDGAIIKIYQTNTTTCIVTTSTVEGTYSKTTSYSFFFINNISYKLNYEEE